MRDSILADIIGGTMRHRSSSLVGTFSHNALQRLRVDIGFFSARGVSAHDGLMESDIEEAQLKQQMVNGSSVVVGIVDSSKFGATAFNVFALPQEVDRIITDESAPMTIVEGLRALGVRVDLV